MHMRTLMGVAVSAAALLAVSPSSKAEEAKLVFATTNPPQVHLNREILTPWAEAINKDGKDVISIDIRHGPTVANHTNYFDRVMSDVVQIAWGLQVVLGPRFELTSGLGLPFVVTEGEAGSTAFWRLYERGDLGAEYEDVQPLFMITFPPNSFHLRNEPKSLDNLKGLKITNSNRYLGKWMQSLGAAPISIVISEAYEAIQRGTADGVLVPFTAFQPFKLAEVTDYSILAPAGANTAWVFMSKKKFNGLPAKARDLVMSHSGEAQSRKFGVFWDRQEQNGRDLATKGKGKILSLNPEQEAKWKELAEAVNKEWAAEVPGGAELLAKFKAEEAKVKSGS